MIKLYGFLQHPDVQDPSPFVLKLHTWLRLTGLEYETVNHFSNLQKAPKGKLPFIDDKETRVADSTLIIEYLKTAYQKDPDGWLSQQEKGCAWLIAKALEEQLYWCLLYARWEDDRGWEQTREAFFSTLPVPLKWIIPGVARKGVIKASKAQGTGRHSHQDVLQLTRQTLDSLAAFLGDKEWMMGDRFCSLDATAFGMLAQYTLVQFDSPFMELARQHGNLVEYCKRVQSACFS